MQVDMAGDGKLSKLNGYALILSTKPATRLDVGARTSSGVQVMAGDAKLSKLNGCALVLSTRPLVRMDVKGG